MKTLKRSECSILSLVLKEKWFEMVSLGQKKEEYRDYSEYWKTRILNWQKKADLEGLPKVIEFRLGYSARAQRTAFLLDDIYVCKPYRLTRPDWGEPLGEHYVMHLGDRVVLEGGETTKEDGEV